MTVDAERLVSGWLRAQPEVQALVDDRVYTVLPATKAWPLVRVTQIGGTPPFSRPLVIDQAALQIDVWGGPKAEARAVVGTIRLLLSEDIIGAHTLGTVANVTFGELAYLPDTDFQPARPRYTFDITVTTRAHPTGS